MDSVKDGNEASGRGPESLPVTMSHTAFTPAPGMRLRDYVSVASMVLTELKVAFLEKPDIGVGTSTFPWKAGLLSGKVTFS